MNRKLIDQIRSITAWLVIPAFICMVVSEQVMDKINPLGNAPWPEPLSRPRSFDIALQIRNYSFLTALITGIISLPRGKAIIGLSLTLIYAAYVYIIFASY